MVTVVCGCGRFRHGGSVPARCRLHGRYSHCHHVSHARRRLQRVRYLRCAHASLLAANCETTVSVTLRRLKSATSRGGSGFVGSTQVYTRNGNSIGSSVSAVFPIVTTQITDHFTEFTPCSMRCNQCNRACAGNTGGCSWYWCVQVST